MICPTGEAKYFCKEDSTQKCPTGKSPHDREEQIPLVSRMEISPSFRGALLREPGIHSHHREYGFRACASKSAVADLDNDIAELG